MKKIIGLIGLTLVFTCCDLGVRDSNAGNTVTTSTNHKFDNISKTIMFEDGMEYHIYTKASTTSYVGGVYVVNHTKEKLEVELLTLQIDSLKR